MKSGEKMQKIMIVEDDQVIKKELQNLLENAGYQTETLENFKEAKKEILKSPVDLILLDINIPELNGEILLKEIRKTANIPIIMVTNGADDYITKPYNPTILLLRIQSIFRRMENKQNNLQYEDLEIIPSKGILKREEKEIELTKNEMIIFIYLVNNKETIVTRDDLMTDLWNNREYINDNALTVNISRLRSKLAEFGYENKIETKKGQGYILL